jgi:5-hydroxyisourate hydrolase-like protein (transthyretin family)
MVFTVDGLETVVNLAIVNPQPKVFVLSGQTLGNSINVATPISNTADGLTSANAVISSATVNNFKFATSGEGYELLKYFDASSNFDTLANMVNKASHQTDGRDKFAELVDGVYTIDLPTTKVANGHGLYANVAVADLALGVHNYKIVKTYPDGRVVTIQDTAEVTSLDANQVAVFGSSTKANNTKFNDNWRIAELSDEFEKGTYTFEFTIGSVSRKFTVNIIDRPLLKLTNVTVGTAVSALYESKFTFKPVDYASTTPNIVLNYSLQNLTTANFVSATISDTGTGTAALSTALSAAAKVALSGSTLTIGTVTGNFTTTQKVTIVLTFWNKVDYSVDTSRYVQVGETQTIVFGYLTPLA